jgi:hypothetical protein
MRVAFGEINAIRVRQFANLYVFIHQAGEFNERMIADPDSRLIKSGGRLPHVLQDSYPFFYCCHGVLSLVVKVKVCKHNSMTKYY